jgi:FtsZ-interacting cell division protein YlmF
MTIIEKLEAALDFLYHDDDEWTETVEAREHERRAHANAEEVRRRDKKRKREADITDVDFDKRLSKLVQAARSGGGMPRGDQYRLLHTPQLQPRPGAPILSWRQWH